MKWFVSIPAWTPTYVERFIEAALPSHREALKSAACDVTYVVYTDDADRIAAAMAGFPDVVFKEVPPGENKYQIFANVHRDTIAMAGHGDYVMLLCADILLSREVFSACEARFAAGKKAIVSPATPTLGPDAPAGLTARELLAWTMEYTHPVAKQVFWGSTSTAPWVVYFRKGDNITLRGFHLHPVAVVKDRDISFRGTLDQDMLENFTFDEIHVVTSPDEMAIAEMSPAYRPYQQWHLPFTIETIARWAQPRCTAVHWWLSTHRIVITGNGDTDDEPVWQQVLAHHANPLNKPSAAA